MDWEIFRLDLEQLLGYDIRDESKGGRPPFDPVFMFKVLVLQRYHSLSDEATEAQIADGFSFWNFWAYVLEIAFLTKIRSGTFVKR